MRYAIKFSYSGAHFCGWQKQADAYSVQEALESALGTLLGAPTAVVGAGRTDTGVNALGYVAHFDAPEGLDAGQICYKLNAILPASIAVHSVREAPEGFHARFDATRREYRYFLHRGKDPFISGYSYYYAYPKLDFEAMNRAAALLQGKHDFACFQKKGSDNKTTVCTVFEAGWKPYRPFPLAVPVKDGLPDSQGAGESEYWYFSISADRFLRNMVRAIVGTLLEVGRGKRTVESVEKLLQDGTRGDAGESVPGHALFLSQIEY